MSLKIPPKDVDEMDDKEFTRWFDAEGTALEDYVRSVVL